METLNNVGGIEQHFGLAAMTVVIDLHCSVQFIQYAYSTNQCDLSRDWVLVVGIANWKE